MTELTVRQTFRLRLVKLSGQNVLFGFSDMISVEVVQNKLNKHSDL